MAIVLGFDVGTQSVKAVVYNSDKREIISNTTSALDLATKPDGSAEQLAHWWTDAIVNCLQQIDATVRSSISAIAVSGQQHGFVAVDEKGDVLCPVKLWCDTSTTAQCEQIINAYGGEEKCIAEMGNTIVAGYTASKVLWLKQTHPELYQKLHTIMLPHDYINFWLTGERCMEYGDASGTGFLNIYEREWSSKMLQAIDADRDLKDCLPPLLKPDQQVGRLDPARADELGLKPDVIVAVGGGDNMMGAIGTANLREGDITISLGTSGTVYGYSDKPIVDPAGQIAAFCSSTGGWLPLLCTMNCTVSTELMRGLLKKDLNDFEKHISESPVGSEGVLTLPFFSGERTPNLPNGKACILGLDNNNVNPANLLRSAVEGVNFGLRTGLEALRKLDMSITSIRLTGGGARSATWRQMLADICQAPVSTLIQDEGAAFGAALQALWLLENSSGSVSLIDIAKEHLQEDPAGYCEPDKERVSSYNEIFRSYQQAVEAVTTLYT